MSPRSKKEYLEAIVPRYRKASAQQKSKILDEFCQTYPCHRKHAIRLLNHYKRFTKPKRKKRGRPSRYKKFSVLKPLIRIWHAAQRPCSKRLKVILPLWLPSYAQEFGILAPKVAKALLDISASTIDRLLKPTRRKYRQYGRSTTRPGTLLRHQIPIKTNQWEEFRPGFLEADTVAHCGSRIEGQYVYTVDFVDIATGWTEQRAVWGRGETDVLQRIKDVEKSLPFPLRGFDCDNGSEFLNHHLLRHFSDPQRKIIIQFTRSRAYKKDDNAHIEQKNNTHIRQWLGYGRFDNPLITELLNDLYTSEWRLLQNFFLPSVKLIDKKRLASKIIKKYDSPKTPLQRVLESDDIDISKQTKTKLTELFNQLNPFKLRYAIDKKIQKILQLASPC